MRVFIAGPRAVTKLNEDIKQRLYSIYDKKITVLIGDANGVDKAVQQYYHDLSYDNIVVYVTGDVARNNIGNWPIQAVPAPVKTKSFAYYAEKDKAMSDNADYGFMIWNGISKGTLNNIMNLITSKKKVLVYFIPNEAFTYIDSLDKLNTLITLCPDKTKELYSDLFSAIS